MNYSYQFLRARADSLRKRYPQGTKVILDYMNEAGMPKGLEGIVDFVDDMATVHITWENGRTLGCAYGEDKFHAAPVCETDYPADVEREAEDGLEP
jgi:hypothetical protein